MDAVLKALLDGRPAILPTDTVYGLAAANTADAARALYALKGRAKTQPTALVAHSIEALLGAVPELEERILRAVLPGPLTLVLPNPALRYTWLAGERPDTIGIRVPALPPAVRAVLAETGPVLATSANEPGEAAAATLDDVPARIRAACPALDAGRLPGTASTVLDLTGSEPRVLREGAAASSDAIARLRTA
jgi:L-threonylcarbamoyladenylate synthase